MVLRRIRRRHHTLSYAVLSFLAFGIALPIVIGSRLDRMAFHSVAALAAARDRVSLGAPLPLIESAGILLERGTVSIVKAQAAGARTSETLLTLLASGNARLVLDNSELVFTSAADVAAVQPPIDAATPIIATMLGSHFESLRINHGTIALPHVGNGLYLNDVNADISLRRKGVISGKGDFVFRGKTVAFDVTVAIGDRRSAHRLPITVRIDSELAHINLDGRITLGSGLQVSASSPEFETPHLRALAAWLGYAWPTDRGFEKVTAQGNFDLADTSVSLQQAMLSIDGNEFSGATFMTFEHGQPTLDATLATRRLDLAPYIAPAKTRAAAVSTSGWRELMEAAGLSGLPTVARMDADLRLSADRVTMGSTSLGRGAATLTARQGRVIADIAELVLDSGGSGTMQVSLDAAQSPPQYMLRGRLRQMDVSRPLPLPATGLPLLAGQGEITYDLAGAGGSFDDIVGSLSGKFGVSLPTGGQIGVDLASLIAVSQANAPVSGWRAATRSGTTLDDLGLRFRIANGLWTLDQARARSGNAVFLGSGAVYPPTLSVDMMLSRINALSSVTEPDGASLPEAAAQTVLVRGPWAAPQILPASGARRPEPAGDGIPKPAPGVRAKPSPGRG